MKAFLFDFGGTLDTNGVHWSEKFWDAYRELKIGISKEEFERAYVGAEARMSLGVIGPNDSMRTTLEKQVALQIDVLEAGGILTPRQGLNAPSSRVAELCYRAVQATIRTVRPLLAACRRNHRLGVVSNFHGNLRAACADLGIEEYFDVFIDSTNVGVRKPDPDIFRISLAELGIASRDALVIGDSYERDIVPAKSIGCVTVWLRGRSWREPSEISGADFVIHSLADMYSFLKPAKQLIASQRLPT